MKVLRKKSAILRKRKAHPFIPHYQTLNDAVGQAVLKSPSFRNGAPHRHTPRGLMTSLTLTRPQLIPYAFLAQFDTVFLIDNSESMTGHFWQKTKKALVSITPICTLHDTNDIDIYFLNHRNGHTTSGNYPNITCGSVVKTIFNMISPTGATPTGTRLGHILKPYMDRVEIHARLSAKGALVDSVKPLNIIVVTDGVASDDVESVIVRTVKMLETCDAVSWWVEIQFFQFGHDLDATADLKVLDDGLAG